MADQKLDNLLNLALDATGEEREKSINLSAGKMCIRDRLCNKASLYGP